MKQYVAKVAMTGFRCLITVVAIGAIGLSTIGSAMGFSQVPLPKKADPRPVPICEQLTAAQTAQDVSGAMTPRQKPTSAPVMSVVAPLMTKTDSDGGKFTRSVATDIASHQCKPSRVLHTSILSSLSLVTPMLAKCATLVGARPSGTM